MVTPVFLTKEYEPNGRVFRQTTKNGLNYTVGNGGFNKISFTTKNDKKEGLYREWYNNHQLSDSSYYANDLLEGVQTLWYENGSIARVANFTEGKANGTVYFYDTSGNLNHTEEYIRGEKQLSVDDIHQAIDLIREEKDNDGDRKLKAIDDKLRIECDSIKVALKLFMVHYKIDNFGYSWYWFRWIQKNYPERISADEYDMFNKYFMGNRLYDQSGILDSAIKWHPNNSNLVFKYAHNYHVRKTTLIEKDDSYKFYEIWLTRFKDTSDNSKMNEVYESFVVHYAYALVMSDCETEMAKSNMQTLNESMLKLRRVNPSSTKIAEGEGAIKSFNDRCEFQRRTQKEHDDQIPEGRKKSKIW